MEKTLFSGHIGGAEGDCGLITNRAEMVTAPKIKIVACKATDIPESKKGQKSQQDF